MAAKKKTTGRKKATTKKAPAKTPEVEAAPKTTTGRKKASRKPATAKAPLKVELELEQVDLDNFADVMKRWDNPSMKANQVALALFRQAVGDYLVSTADLIEDEEEQEEAPKASGNLLDIDDDEAPTEDDDEFEAAFRDYAGL